MDTKDIYWLAGLLEGEAHFGLYNSPRISLRMNDRDVVEKAALLMKIRGRVLTIHRANDQATAPSYEANLGGAAAIGLMLTLYPLMGRRRQQKIREIVDEWKRRPMRPRPPKKLLCGHPDRKHAARRMCRSCYTMWKQGRLKKELHPEVFAAGLA